MVLWAITILVLIILVIAARSTGDMKAEKYYGKGKITGEFQFSTNLAGVSKKSQDGFKRQELLQELSTDEILYLIPEPDNPYDSNAIKVFDAAENDIGFIPKDTAKSLSKNIRKGDKFFGQVKELMGGDEGMSYGLLIDVYKVESE